nr:hypothetical protein [uncultured Flavobacterium sp.]
MKNLLLLLTIAIALSCCDKDDDKPKNPIDQLPPATQTGANTFGCLLDGEVFKPGLTNNSLDCVYQNINNEYYFSLQGNRRDTNNNLIRLGCSTQNLQIIEGQTYQLKERIDGNANGKYFFNLDFSYTTTTEVGELKITKLDFTNNIVSGTFWFDVKDSKGVIHQIREGRFDMQFTQ